MRNVTVAAVVISSIALAQPAQKLPGGAVMKPGRPAPVVPLEAPKMKPLSPYVGTFSSAATDKPGATARCQLEVGGRWLRCEVTASDEQWSAMITVGWDASTRAYRAIMVDSRAMLTAYAGKLDGSRLALSSPRERVTLDLSTADRLFISLPGGVMTFVRSR